LDWVAHNRYKVSALCEQIGRASCRERV
jgi:hypothetical protein